MQRSGPIRQGNRQPGKITLMALTLGIFFNWIQTFPIHAQGITVSAAMSLKEVLTEMGKSFEEVQKGTRVLFNFGASGDLVRQIVGGAAVDIIASAGLKEMDDLEQKGLVAPGTQAAAAG